MKSRYNWTVLEPKIKEMLQSHKTQSEIASVLRIPLGSLHRFLTKQNLRQRKYAKRHSYNWELLEPKIIELMQSNKTIKEIASALDISFHSINYYLAKRNLRRTDVVGVRTNKTCYKPKNNCNIVDSFLAIIKNGATIDAAIDEICIRYNVDPEEVCELVNQEIATVSQCYAIVRSQERLREELTVRYGFKPTARFIANTLYFSNKSKFVIPPEPPQPADAIFVPDPDGVYCGFWLTEEQAIRLAEIRCQIRLVGDEAPHVAVTITKKSNTGKRLSFDEKSALIEDYKDGLKISQIQNKYNLARSSIYRILDNAGLLQKEQIIFQCRNCGSTVVTTPETGDRRTTFCCQRCERLYWKNSKSKGELRQ